MVSRKPLKAPVVDKSFLEGAPVTTAEPPKMKIKHVRTARDLSRDPENTTVFQVRIALPQRELHAVKPVSMKIPMKLYEDIDRLRRETGITATDIFVKCAEPEVAELIRQLDARKGS